MAYEFLIGLKKALKNLFITLGIPALLYLLTNAKAWMPEEYTILAGTLASLGSYLVKNYKENKDNI